MAPIDQRARFKRWSDAVVGGGTAGMSNAGARREMADFFTDLTRERRRNWDLLAVVVGVVVS